MCMFDYSVPLFDVPSYKIRPGIKSHSKDWKSRNLNLPALIYMVSVYPLYRSSQVIQCWRSINLPNQVIYFCVFIHFM